jgi:hypothetical protein
MAHVRYRPGDYGLRTQMVANQGYRPTGAETFPMNQPIISSIGGTSGTSKFAGFVPLVPFQMNQVEIWCGAVAAVTPTRIVYAIHSVDASGNLTRLGVTANDTTMMSATNTAYPKAFTSSAGTAIPGQRYVVEFFCSAATMPQIYGVQVSAAATLALTYGQTYRQFFNGPAGQTDSLASYTGGQLQTTGNYFYAWVGP